MQATKRRARKPGSPNILRLWRKQAELFCWLCCVALNTWIVVVALSAWTVFKTARTDVPSTRREVLVFSLVLALSTWLIVRAVRTFTKGRGRLPRRKFPLVDRLFRYRTPPSGIDHFAKELGSFVCRFMVLGILVLITYTVLMLIGFFVWVHEASRPDEAFIPLAIRFVLASRALADKHFLFHMGVYLAYLSTLTLTRISLFEVAPAAVPRRLLSIVGSADASSDDDKYKCHFRHIYWYMFTKVLIRRNFVQFAMGFGITVFVPLFVLLADMRDIGIGTALTYSSFWSTGVLLWTAPSLISFFYLDTLFEEHTRESLIRQQVGRIDNHVIIGPWDATARIVVRDLFRRFVVPREYADPSFFDVLIDKRGKIRVVCSRFLVVTETLATSAELYDSENGLGVVMAIEKGKHEEYAAEGDKGEDDPPWTVYCPAVEGSLGDRSVLTVANYSGSVLLVSLDANRGTATAAYQAIQDLTVRGHGRPELIPSILCLSNTAEHDFLLSKALRRGVYLLHTRQLCGTALARQIYPSVVARVCDASERPADSSGSLESELLVLLGDGRVMYEALESLWTLLSFHVDREDVASWLHSNAFVVSDDPYIGNELISATPTAEGRESGDVLSAGKVGLVGATGRVPRASQAAECYWGVLLHRCASPAPSSAGDRSYHPEFVKIRALYESPENVEAIWHILTFLDEEQGADPHSVLNSGGAQSGSRVKFVICSMCAESSVRITSELCRALEMLNYAGRFSIECNFVVVSPTQEELGHLEHIVEWYNTRLQAPAFSIAPLVRTGEILANQILDLCSTILRATSSYSRERVDAGREGEPSSEEGQAV